MENPYDIYVYLKQHNIQKLAHLFPIAPLVGICWYDHIPSPMPFAHPFQLERALVEANCLDPKPKVN